MSAPEEVAGRRYYPFQPESIGGLRKRGLSFNAALTYLWIVSIVRDDGTSNFFLCEVSDALCTSRSSADRSIAELVRHGLLRRDALPSRKGTVSTEMLTTVVGYAEKKAAVQDNPKVRLPDLPHVTSDVTLGRHASVTRHHGCQVASPRMPGGLTTDATSPHDGCQGHVTTDAQLGRDQEEERKSSKEAIREDSAASASVAASVEPEQFSLLPAAPPDVPKTPPVPKQKKAAAPPVPKAAKEPKPKPEPKVKEIDPRFPPDFKERIAEWHKIKFRLDAPVPMTKGLIGVLAKACQSVGIDDVLVAITGAASQKWVRDNKATDLGWMLRDNGFNGQLAKNLAAGKGLAKKKKDPSYIAPYDADEIREKHLRMQQGIGEDGSVSRHTWDDPCPWDEMEYEEQEQVVQTAYLWREFSTNNRLYPERTHETLAQWAEILDPLYPRAASYFHRDFYSNAWLGQPGGPHGVWLSDMPAPLHPSFRHQGAA